MRRAGFVNLQTASVILLLITIAPSAQEVVQDRCANNKARIAALETEMNELKMDSQPKPVLLAETRYEYSMLNQAIYNLNSTKWASNPSVRAMRNRIHKNYGGYAEYARIKDLEWNKTIDATNPKFIKDFMIAMRNHLEQKIKAYVKLRNEFPAAMARYGELNRQKTAHEANIKALRCDEPDTCNIAGEWANRTPSVGNSVWTVTADGTAKESGMGAATGTATLSGNVMRINWRHPNGWSGLYEWTMERGCTTGSGDLTFYSGGSGKHSSTVTHK